MKKIIFSIAVLVFCLNFGEAQILQTAKNKATRTAANEAGKKAQETVKGLFNKKKKKKETEEKQPSETTASGTAEPTQNTNSEPQGNAKEPAVPTRKKSDFIPGEDEIFNDLLKRELMGEFPSKWDLKKGTVENMKFEGVNVIGFTASQSEIFPLIDEEHYLPERFTIEFDCYFHDYGNEGYYINFDKGGSYRVNIHGITHQDIIRTNVKNRVGWRHIELSFNKRAMKIYYEGDRLVNIPRLKERPTNVTFSALSHGQKNGKYAMIKNVRIAEGGVPLYNRLITDGKIVTNDIHFDYNKATIKPESEKIISDISKMLTEHSDINLSIEGHTDGDGKEAYNLELSQKRAAAVKAALVGKGIDANRLKTKGLGETKPIDSNETSEGKAKNRRVEFVLLDS